MITLTNPNRTIEVSPETGVWRTDALRPGDFGRATGEGADRLGYAAMSSRVYLKRFAVGALVIIPLDPKDFFTDWECFEVAENPDFEAPEPPRAGAVRVVSFDEFNVRRHGE